MSARARLTRFSTVCDDLGIALQTGYNRVHRGAFPLPVLRIGRMLFCRQADLEQFIETGLPVPAPAGAVAPTPAARIGRPTKAEQVARRRAGGAA